VIKFTQTVSPYVKQVIDYTTEKYQQLFADRLTA